MGESESREPMQGSSGGCVLPSCSGMGSRAPASLQNQLSVLRAGWAMAPSEPWPCSLACIPNTPQGFCPWAVLWAVPQGWMCFHFCPRLRATVTEGPTILLPPSEGLRELQVKDPRLKPVAVPSVFSATALPFFPSLLMMQQPL